MTPPERAWDSRWTAVEMDEAVAQADVEADAAITAVAYAYSEVQAATWRATEATRWSLMARNFRARAQRETDT